MVRKIALNLLWMLPLIIFTSLSITAISAQSASSPNSTNAYPLPAKSDPSIVYPPPDPGKLPLQGSDAVKKALEYIAERYAVPVEDLIIKDDHPVEYPSLGLDFQSVTLIDQRPKGEIYKLLVNLTTGEIEEDGSALADAEAKAYETRYGKLDPALYQRLAKLGDNDTVNVMIWMTALPNTSLADQQQAIFAALAAKYPKAREAMQKSGNPMDVEDRQLANQIKAEYLSLLNTGMKARTAPLVNELQNDKYSVSTFDGMPSFMVTLPKHTVLELSKREDVGMIYLAEDHPTPLLDDAMPSDRAPAVWDRFISGYGQIIGIIESGRINPSGSYLNLVNTRLINGALSDHTTKVAACAASDNSTYTGMAWQASVLSANHNSTQADLLNAVTWAVNQGANVLNISEVWSSGLNMSWSDQAFDYLAREYLVTITAAAGNCVGTTNVVSPGKGWNVISVGEYDDHDDPDWNNDTMPTAPNCSSWVNPPNGDIHNDREKPEVVAPGVNITAYVNNNTDTSSGTSLAAPQVAGLATLLISRDEYLAEWPVAQKAIIMASATHNIDGPSVIDADHGDLLDGAGGINADEADKVAQVEGNPSTDCYTSCWWGEFISNSNFPVYSYKYYTFYVDQPTLIRVAIAWLAYADIPSGSSSFSQLRTDLDLRIYDPDGIPINEATSASWDNNYEMGEFFARQPGEYQIAIRKASASLELYNYLGTALVMIPMPNSAYLPLIIR